MMTLHEAKEVVAEIIIQKGRGFDWKVYHKFRYDISTNAKHLAIDVLDQDSNMKKALKAAVEYEISGKIHMDWLYRTTALMLDDDKNGNHISVDMLRLVQKYRVNVLGIDY